MTRWLAHGAINIIWTKKIYNDLHVRVYVEKICVLRRPFFLSRILSLFLSLSFTPSLSLSPIRSLVRSPPFHACIRLACTYSINREPRYCTASPHPLARVTFTLARVNLHTFDSLQQSWTLSEAALVRVPASKLTGFFFFVVISINKEIPIQGRTLAYPMR